MIDRISMLVVIGSDDLYKVLYGQLLSMREERKVLVPNGSIQVQFNKVKYTTRLDYYPEYAKSKGGKRKIADITIGKNKIQGQEKLYRHLTLTLYPSRFEVDDFERFKDTIDSFFQEYGYSAFYNFSKVNYLELARDTKSHLNHTFLPYQSYISRSGVYKGKDGSCGTIYIGSSKSNAQFRIYDKQKKNIADGLTTNGEDPLTRFESVQKRLGLSPCELVKMCNPFPKLKIADLGKAKAMYVDSEWPGFLVTCQFEGVPRALHMIKEQARRKKYKAALNSIPVPWWNPHAAWKHFPDALLKIAP